MVDIDIEAAQALRGATVPLPWSTRWSAVVTVLEEMAVRRNDVVGARQTLEDLGLTDIRRKPTTTSDPLRARGTLKRAVPGRMQSRAKSPGI